MSADIADFKIREVIKVTVLKINIRRAEEGDRDSFVECYLKAYRGLEGYSYTSRRDIRSYFNWLRKRDREGIFAAEVIMQKDFREVAGFLACDSKWFSKYEGTVVCEIHEIFVKPEWRGIGIGEMLMRRAMEYAEEKGREIIELWVGERNYNAIKFYRKFGFKDKEKNGCWIRMVKRLENSANRKC